MEANDKEQYISDSHIFNILVDNESDVQGSLAYTRYKFEKIDFIKRSILEKGKEPTEDEKKEFRKSCCEVRRLAGFEELATNRLSEFLNDLFKIKLDEIEAKKYKEVEEQLRKTLIESLKTKEAVEQIRKALIESQKTKEAEELLKKTLIESLKTEEVDNHIKEIVKTFKPKKWKRYLAGVSMSLLASLIASILIPLGIWFIVEVLGKHKIGNWKYMPEENKVEITQETESDKTTNMELVPAKDATTKQAE